MGCTIVARNYLPFARVLASSFRHHNPDHRFEALVIDAEEGRPADPELSVRTLDQIDLPLEERRRMATIYDATELATAVKPWLLARLLEEGAASVLYFDPDIEVFARLDDLFVQTAQSGIVLVPHTTQPLPRDGRTPSEADILRVGVYNLGFLGVSPAAGEMLRWWQARLRRDAIRDPPNMLFTDQRWVDLVPGYFQPAILRDEALNVAYWNLDSRRLEFGGSSGYLINGRPLRFFHFSGFDPHRPSLLSKHPGDSARVRTRDNPVLAELCGRYAEKLIAAGYGDRVPAYGFGTMPGGMALDSRMRLLYRDALLRSESGRGTEPPNPFRDGQSAFLDWLREPAEGVAIPRYLFEVYRRRPDLHVHYPDPAGIGARGFLDWVREGGGAEVGVPDELIPGLQPADSAVGLLRGLNLAGYFRAELGVGEAARQLVAAVEAAGIPFTTLTFDRTLNRQSAAFQERGQSAQYDVNVVCVNADQLPIFAAEVGPQFFRDRYTVGLWFWETEDLPPSMHQAFEYVDEVWAASAHVKAALEKVSPRPVFEIPLPFLAQLPASVDRRRLQLPDGFLFLFSFDFLSVFDRKNPLGVVEAFRLAFEPGQGPKLLLKSINGDLKPDQLERLRQAAAGRDDILVRDGYLAGEDNRAVTAACDCYVSLHRAEGFGLTMAAAMAEGKPVIATAYSGNLAFMTPENSFLVPWRPVPVGPGSEPYLPHTVWAEPDLQAAAAFMRQVYEEPATARVRGEQARRDIRQQRTAKRAGEFLTARLEAIRASPENWLTAKREPAVKQTFAAAAGPPPAAGVPTRHGGAYGLAARAFRRVVLRVIRPYRVQQDAVNATLGRQVERLRSHVEAIPYMSDPGLLRTSDSSGRAAIGYRGLPPGDADGYRGFEDIFRGSEDFIRERQRVYVGLLAEHPPVLEAGCGRGEMLDLLQQAGVPAMGVDLDGGMVARCRAKGHQVEQAGLLEYLEARPADSLGAIFAAQVIEHLKYQDLLRLLELARQKLKPGGLLILETVNPHSARAMKTFWVDLTHEKPIFPEVAVAMCRLHGYEEAIVMFPNGVGELERDLYAEGEYAVLARTPSRPRPIAPPVSPRSRRRTS